MPCYTGAVTVPSSSEGSIKKLVHFNGVEVTTEKSPVSRRVLWTSEHSQFVTMTGPSGGQLEDEVIPWTSILPSQPAPRGREESHRRRSDYSPCGYQSPLPQFWPQPAHPLHHLHALVEHREKTVHRTKEEGDKAEKEG